MSVADYLKESGVFAKVQAALYNDFLSSSHHDNMKQDISAFCLNHSKLKTAPPEQNELVDELTDEFLEQYNLREILNTKDFLENPKFQGQILQLVEHTIKEIDLGIKPTKLDTPVVTPVKSDKKTVKRRVSEPVESDSKKIKLTSVIFKKSENEFVLGDLKSLKDQEATISCDDDKEIVKVSRLDVYDLSIASDITLKLDTGDHVLHVMGPNLFIEGHIEKQSRGFFTIKYWNGMNAKERRSNIYKLGDPISNINL